MAGKKSALVRRVKPVDERIRYILCVSDLHCGSSVAVMPRNFVSPRNGHTIGPSKTQRALIDAWDELCAMALGVIGKAPFALAHLGDAIQGRVKHESMVWSDVPEDQVSAAYELLAPLAAKAERTYIVTGTEIHVRDAEESLGERLQAVVDPDTGHHCSHQFNVVTRGGYVIRLLHHLPASSVKRLQVGALGRYLHDAQTSAMYARRDGADIDIPDCIIGGHRHQPGHARDGRSMCIALPAWQLLNRHAIMVVGTAVPYVGFTVIDLENVERFGFPIVHEFHRPMVQFGRVTL